LDLIKRFEGVRKQAYLDSGGIPTIGVGHTQGVELGMVWTDAQIDAAVIEDASRAQQNVELALGSVPLTSNQLAACTSLAFNIGTGAFASSTVCRLIKARDVAGAARAFTMWDKANVNGQLVVLPGLLARRQAEAALFLTPDDGWHPPEQSGVTAVAKPQGLMSTTTMKGAVTAAAGGIGTAVVAIGAAAPDIAPQVQTIADSLAGWGLTWQWIHVFPGVVTVLGAVYAIKGWVSLRGEGRAY
jgi:lysozyme